MHFSLKHRSVSDLDQSQTQISLRPRSVSDPDQSQTQISLKPRSVLDSDQSQTQISLKPRLIGPRFKTNSSADCFQYRVIYCKQYTHWIMARDETKSNYDMQTPPHLLRNGTQNTKSFFSFLGDLGIIWE